MRLSQGTGRRRQRQRQRMKKTQHVLYFQKAEDARISNMTFTPRNFYEIFTKFSRNVHDIFKNISRYFYNVRVSKSRVSKIPSRSGIHWSLWWIHLCLWKNDEKQWETMRNDKKRWEMTRNNEKRWETMTKNENIWHPCALGFSKI